MAWVLVNLTLVVAEGGLSDATLCVADVPCV
jgi:hypothetical protein